MVKRIAFIGPESTGKSTLCEQLAIHYHTVWVPEYARSYISKQERPYTLHDIEQIASKQLELETVALPDASRFLFVDTELINVKVWCEDVFNYCPPWIEKKIMEIPYDFYMLTLPDLPWKEDPVRENGNRRYYFFNLYRTELMKRGLSFSILSGFDEIRFQNAISILEKL